MSGATGRSCGNSQWEEAARDYRSTPTLWRFYSDRVYKTLFEDWLPGERYHRALKTDLFDELFGKGLILELVRRSQEVHGIDVSGFAVARVREKSWPVEARVDDVRSLSYPDSHFDLVVSNSTLDHFRRPEDLERALRELMRVLRRGGTCLISLDNLSNPVVRLRQNLPYGWLHRFGILPYFVGHTLGHDEFAEKLRSVGLEVIRHKAVMHVPRLPAVLLCRLADHLGHEGLNSRILSFLLAFERLGRLPTAIRTGYFTVALCRKV